MQQTFSVGPEPRVSLTRVSGDLQVRGWDRREISLDWDEHGSNFHQEGNALILTDCAGDIELRVPYDTEIRVEGLGGEVLAQDIRRVELKDVRGDVELRDIGADASLEYIGAAVSLTDIGGDLQVQKATSLHARGKIGGDADLQEVPLIEIETVGGDVTIHQAETVAVGNVGGDLEISDLREVLRCGNVGGDCELNGSSQAEINLGNVGGDLEIAGALLVHLGNTGGDTDIHDVQRGMNIGNIGGDASIIGVGGDLKAGRIGADAMLRGLGRSIHVGGIGGDLDLQAAFAPESRSQLHVGGDARITLPDGANLALQATVGGSVSGESISFGGGGSLVRLVYGEGAAHVNLSVGGDLTLRGGGSPQVSSASMPWWEFGQEMAELGQEMARMGQELGEEFKEIFSDLGWTGVVWTDEIGRKVEEQVRRAREKAEHNARKAEERARQAQERAWQAQERARQRAERGRVRMRINEREWQMNQARLDDLVNRAQQAAMEGVAGAMEAVERAVGNLRGPRPPYPPRPGSPPPPPAPPMPPTPSAGGPVPPTDFPPPPSGDFSPHEQQPAPGQAAQPESEPAPNLEQEREAILRMIAEGRITPEEGDMLLEGLGS
jgi:DUF4097 and DUF4098 domain-containing protein YvlB